MSFVKESDKALANNMARSKSEALVRGTMDQYRRHLRKLKGAKYQPKLNHSIHESKQLFQYYRIGAEFLKKFSGRMDVLENSLRKTNYNNAKIIYKKVFFDTGNLKVKRAFSLNEIDRHLNKNNNIIKFSKEARNISEAASKAIKIFNKVEKVWDFFETMYEIKTHMDIAKTNSTMKTTAKSIRNDLDNAYKGMNKIMDAVSLISDSFAPPGIKEYIGFIVDSFKAADKGIGIARKHAEDIEFWLDEIDKEREKNADSPETMGNYHEHTKNSRYILETMEKSIYTKLITQPLF
jgi:hypothetical protein